MSSANPIYTLDNCPAAYQLNWSLSVFWREPVQKAEWFADLQEATQPDGVRVLQHRFPKPGVSQFLVSTKPEIAPPQLVRSVKGRLQYLVRDEHPKALRRHYGFRSVGTVKREVIENYVRTQREHHAMADPDVQQRLKRIQIQNPDADLSRPQYSGHAKYWYHLHVVFVHECRYMEIRQAELEARRDMILRASAKRNHLLSCAAIVPDHVHLTLGCRLNESPAEVALSYMNNLAFASGMKPVFRFGFYAGTFGEYDLGVVPQA